MPELELIRRGPRRRRSAPPLLFVHGAYTGAWCWEEYFLEHFADLDFDCYAVSLRGHGGSAGHEVLDYAGLGDYVDDLRATVRRLPAAPVVIGHSMGGVVAQRYAAAHGTAGLVLIASVPPAGLMGSALELCWRDPHLMAQFTLVQTGCARLADYDRLRTALFGADMPAARALGYFARMHRESQRALFDLCWLPAKVCSLGEGLPLAVIGGEQDGLFRPDAVHMTARYLGTNAVILPGLGHTMMLDCRWRRAADYIAEWLEKNILAAADSPASAGRCFRAARPLRPAPAAAMPD